MKKKLTTVLLTGCLAVSALGAVPVSAAEKTDLVIATDADVDTLHLCDFSTTVEMDVLNQLYDPLMYMNPDGDHDPEPRIAESYEVSEDGLDYTFHLRDDVTFHDGSRLTAEDVKFSLELYLNSEYQDAQVAGLASVDAVDDTTVVCHLENAYSPFLLGVCQCHIGSKAYYELSEDDFANNPIGSGPYRFVGRNKGSSITLEAYDAYYRGEAAIKNVTFNILTDQSGTAIALRQKSVNFATIESVTISQLPQDGAIVIEEVPTSGFTYVAMNTEKTPFDNVQLRQAVNYALNRENIVAICYDGEAEVNSNICSKDRFGYSDDQFQYTYDPQKAAELLAEAGIETPYDLGTILVAEKYSSLAQVVQSDLAAVGLNVNIDVKEFNAYINQLMNGDYDLTALEMTLDGDVQNLEMAFTTDYIGMANNARYSDPEMDDLFAQTLAETDPDVRAALFDTIFTKAQDEAIYAVICNPLTLFAHDADLNCQEFPFEGVYSIYNFSWAE